MIAAAQTAHGQTPTPANSASALLTPITNVTRYLCAAAYRDTAFCNTVIERSHEKFRAAAPEIGVDVALVAKHCRQADRSKALRDFALGVLSIIAWLLVLPAFSDDDFDAFPTTFVVLLWLAATSILMIEATATMRVVQPKFGRTATLADQIQARTPEKTANVVVYSGFSPFVGSGADLGGWSFAVDLERGKRDASIEVPKAFELADLYSYVGQAFEYLEIPNLRLGRKLFVSGQAIRENRDFLPGIYGPPVSYVDEGIVRTYSDGDCKGVRHYLSVEVTDWEGELVVSQFIHFRKLPTKLFVELSAFLLPPLKPDFYEIDRLHSNMRPKDYFAFLVASAIKAPFLLVFALFIVYGRISRAIGKSSANRKLRDEIEENLLFDYGAKQSLREIATSTQWRMYFQKLDKEMHQKILQQQFIDSLVDFLDTHGIDTSEIKERAMHILNNGVIVSGGSINAQGLAVGAGAQSTIQNVMQQVRGQAKQ
jgi:hypothetical protein